MFRKQIFDQFVERCEEEIDQWINIEDTSNLFSVSIYMVWFYTFLPTGCEDLPGCNPQGLLKETHGFSNFEILNIPEINRSTK